MLWLIITNNINNQHTVIPSQFCDQHFFRLIIFPFSKSDTESEFRDRSQMIEKIKPKKILAARQIFSISLAFLFMIDTFLAISWNSATSIKAFNKFKSFKNVLFFFLSHFSSGINKFTSFRRSKTFATSFEREISFRLEHFRYNEYIMAATATRDEEKIIVHDCARRETCMPCTQHGTHKFQFTLYYNWACVWVCGYWLVSISFFIIITLILLVLFFCWFNFYCITLCTYFYSFYQKYKKINARSPEKYDGEINECTFNFLIFI